MMRRIVFLACCLSLLVPAAVADARSGRGPRVEVLSYAKPAGVWTSHYDESFRSLPEDTFILQPRKGEKTMSFSFVDLSGRDVLFHIRQGAAPDHQGPTGDHPYADGVIECGTSYTGFQLDGLDPVEISVYVGLCPDHTFGYATSGTITATFGR